MMHEAQSKTCTPRQEYAPWSILNLGLLAALREVSVSTGGGLITV